MYNLICGEVKYIKMFTMHYGFGCPLNGGVVDISPKTFKKAKNLIRGCPV